MAISGRGGIVEALMEQQGLMSPARDINEFALPQQEQPSEKFSEFLPQQSEKYSPNFEETFQPFDQNLPAPSQENQEAEMSLQPQNTEGYSGSYNIDQIEVAPPTGQDIVDPGIIQQQPVAPGEQEGGGYYIPEQQINLLYDPYGLGKGFLQSAYQAAGIPLSRGFVGNVPGHHNFGGGFDGGGGGATGGGGGATGGGGGATGGGGGATGAGGLGGGATGGGFGGSGAGPSGTGSSSSTPGGAADVGGMSAAEADAAAAAQAAADAESYGDTMGGDEDGAGPEGGADDEGDDAGEV